MNEALREIAARPALKSGGWNITLVAVVDGAVLSLLVNHLPSVLHPRVDVSRLLGSDVEEDRDKDSHAYHDEAWDDEGGWPVFLIPIDLASEKIIDAFSVKRRQREREREIRHVETENEKRWHRNN